MPTIQNIIILYHLVNYFLFQTLSRSFNRPDFRKSTIKITETVTDSESEEEDEVPAPIKTSEPSLQVSPKC